MSLYYNFTNYELKEIDDTIFEQWKLNNNPKYNYYIPAPEKPSDNAIWGNGFWIVSEPTIPQTISARQIRIWLIQHGVSLQSVETAIDNISDTLLRDITRVEWEYATYLERNHPMLPVLAVSLGFEESILDQLFMEANLI